MSKALHLHFLRAAEWLDQQPASRTCGLCLALHGTGAGKSRPDDAKDLASCYFQETSYLYWFSAQAYRHRRGRIKEMRIFALLFLAEITRPEPRKKRRVKRTAWCIEEESFQPGLGPND